MLAVSSPWFEFRLPASIFPILLLSILPVPIFLRLILPKNPPILLLRLPKPSNQLLIIFPNRLKNLIEIRPNRLYFLLNLLSLALIIISLILVFFFLFGVQFLDGFFVLLGGLLGEGFGEDYCVMGVVGLFGHL